MFYCLECHREFEHLKAFVETHGLYESPYEITGGCPYCGGEYTKLFTCEKCGEKIFSTYIKLEDNVRICDDCYDIYDFAEEEF